MWSRVATLAALLATAACAIGAQVDVKPTGLNVYELRLTTQPGDQDRRHAELAKRASALCPNAYQLTFEAEIVTVCTDACTGREATIATLSCEAA